MPKKILIAIGIIIFLIITIFLIVYYQPFIRFCNGFGKDYGLLNSINCNSDRCRCIGVLVCTKEGPLCLGKTIPVVYMPSPRIK